MILAASRAGGSPPPVLVLGTRSCPNAAELNYAVRTTGFVRDLLSAAGVGAVVVDENRLEASSLDGAAVAVLPYNPSPPKEHADLYRKFVSRGGRLVVFYSSDGGLADLMGVRLGRYLSVRVPGKWSSFRFNDGAPPRVPPEVRQGSRSIRPVFPARADARVIAEWISAGGSPTGDPAWIASKSGFWMTHILLDDGDTASKSRMLIAMLGACDPAVWRDAAGAASSGIPGFAGDDASVIESVARMAAGSPNSAAILAVLDRARSVCADRLDALRDGRHADVVERRYELGGLLADAYGLAQRPRRPEMRAVWDHSGIGLYPGDWDRTCGLLAGAGFTDLFVNLLGTGWCHYPGGIFKASDLSAELGDQLAACSEAARRHGLRIHIWKLCWNLEGAPAQFVSEMRRRGRLQASVSGEEVAWLDPAHPDNVRLEIDSLVQAVRRAGVDGVHLDYIRYPGPRESYSEISRREFERETGLKAESWPYSARSGAMGLRYRQWRAARITQAVNGISGAVRAAAPGVLVSASVFGKYPLCAESVGQDWAGWIRSGSVDFVCPMDYTADGAAFRDLLLLQARIEGCEGRIIPGIGVTAKESRLGAVQAIDQVRLVRQLGFAGFSLFDVNPVLEKEILPILSLGLTAP